MNQKLKAHNKYTETLIIAIPAVLENLFSVIITSIDTKMVSVLGKDAISAISFTSSPKLIFFSIFFALGTTLTIFVSQAYGKKDAEEANYYLKTILKIGILLSVVLGILLYVFAGPVMSICSRQKETLDLSITFFAIVMGGMIFNSVMVILNAALRGIGETKVTLISNVAMGIVDIIFNYFLIDGRCGFPKMGVAGDAIATVLGTVAACLISFLFLIHQKDFLSLKGYFTDKLSEHTDRLKEVSRKAGNITTENLFTRLGFLLSSIIVSTLPSSQTAVYSVAMLLLNYSFAFGNGIQDAVVALTGRSVGARKMDDLKEYIRIGRLYAIAVSVCLSIIYCLTSRWFFGMYFDDPASVEIGMKTAWIAAFLTIVQILRIVQVAIMRGLGQVKDPRRLATLCVLVINPLTSWLFAIILNLDIWGIWAASVISQLAWLIGSQLLYTKNLRSLHFD